VPVSVWNGSSWVPAKAMPVWNGSSWVPGKKAKVWNGSSWVLAWVPPVVSATLSLSKTGVSTGEAYSVTLTAPGGFPEGAVVTFRFTGYSTTVNPAEGATTATISGASHASAGSFAWYADVATKGGNTTFGPTTQTATVPAPTHFHEVVPSGSGRQQIQDAMDRAYNFFMANQTGTAVNFDNEQTMACVELPAGATYTLDGPLYVRRGVRLIGGGSGASRPLINAQTADSIMFRTGNNGGGGYLSPFYDWLVQNIRLNCSGWTGGFSISHCKRFRIKGCDFTGLGGKKHYVEINSSGGPRADGTFNVEVLNCYFTMPNGSSNPNKPRRTEDECVQADYSWTASASDVANDGTMANNILVDGCTFYRVPRGVGSHHYEDGVGGEAPPLGIHANIVVQNCTFQEVNPTTYGDGANGSGSEGAVRAYFWSNVHILSNTFIDCLQPINLYIQAEASTRNGEPRYTRIAGNVIRNKTSTRPGINATSAHPTLRFEQVLVEYNNVDGTWGGTDYFVAIEDTGTETLPASADTVVIRNNLFAPSNLTVAEEKAYNKYRAKGSNNAGGVLIYDNTVSDGAVDNS
jgi:hypothetical protein